VTSQIITSHHYLESNRISIYLSTSNSEIRTDPLIRHAFGSGKSLFVPFCPIDRPKVMKMLRLMDLAQFEALRENRWGIREPVDEVGMEEALDPGSDAGGGGLDLIIVPGGFFPLS
jgi:5-formyltetrahydrofolate cyclo-ligase